MTGQYLRNITADYITGVVSACEGVKNSLVLLNGPLGCRFYHSYGTGHNFIREEDLWALRGDLQLEHGMDDSLLRSQYYAGTPKVPGTNLRYEDNIFGTREQLHRALNDIFAERRYCFFVVIQTPGTSLLGEALEAELDEISREFNIPHLFVESPQFSTNSCIGYDETTVKLLKLFLPDMPKRRSEKKRVNIFGLHSYAKHLEGDLEEISRLLALCGIEINCAMGANCSLDEIYSIPSAGANIFLSPERCKETKTYLDAHCDIPSLDFGCMPIGFDLSERFIREICKLLNADPSVALEDIERSRARAFYCIAKHMGSRGFPRQLRYCVEGECSLIGSYVDFLSGYLGLKPAAIHPLYTQDNEDGRIILKEKLRAIHSEDALTQDIARVRDVILLGSANTIMELSAYSGNIYGIEIASPSSSYINVIPKTHLGSRGALFLLEQLLNGVRQLRAWK